MKKVISTQEFIQKYKHVNFQKMARTESCPRVRERLLGIHNLMLGKNRIEVRLNEPFSKGRGRINCTMGLFPIK